MRSKLHIRIFLTLLVSFAAASAVQAAACTYNEAIMAYESDNSVRGLALMRMAASDGDARAVSYLASPGDRIVNPVSKNTLMAGSFQNPAKFDSTSTPSRPQ